MNFWLPEIQSPDDYVNQFLLQKAAVYKIWKDEVFRNFRSKVSCVKIALTNVWLSYDRLFKNNEDDLRNPYHSHDENSFVWRLYTLVSQNAEHANKQWVEGIAWREGIHNVIELISSQEDIPVVKLLRTTPQKRLEYFYDRFNTYPDNQKYEPFE